MRRSARRRRPAGNAAWRIAAIAGWLARHASVRDRTCPRRPESADVPIVSTRFPDGERVQIQRPPAVADGKRVFSARKPMAVTPRPEQLDYADPSWRALIGGAVRERRNIVFSGQVGSGKGINVYWENVG